MGLVSGKFCSSMMTGHISRTFGSQPSGAMERTLPVLTAAAVYGIILLFSVKMLSRLNRATVIDLLVTEQGFGRSAKVKDGLRRSNRLPVNLLLGLHEARHGYGIIFGLLLSVSLLITIPLRTVQTMKDDEFVTYMGSSVCDLLLEVEQGGDVEKRNQAADSLLQTAAGQGAVEHIDVLRQVRLQAVREEDGKAQRFTVSGIYQDVTSGGRTAKTVCTFPDAPAEKYIYRITVSSSAPEHFAADLRRQLGGGYSVENMEEFLRQTLGGVTSQVRQAGIAVLFIGICLTALITALFLKLRLAREASALVTKKAMGIPFAAIRRQELYPVLTAGGFGALCGTALAELFGDKLISGLFGLLGMGLKKIVFVRAQAWQYLAVPAVLLAALWVVTIGICPQIRRLDMAEHINE